MLAFRRIAAFLAVFLVLISASHAVAAGKTPAATPEPVAIPADVLEPPEQIKNMIAIAENEWSTLNGKGLPRSNKYTKWYNQYEWGWCAGFTSWCGIQAGIPNATLNAVMKKSEGKNAPVFICSAVSPAKQLRACQHLGRTAMIPQKGFFMLYGDGKNTTVHIGLVTDVVLLDNGKYRITTIEGNMRAKEGNTRTTVVKYVADYVPVDVYSEQGPHPAASNLSQVPEEERDTAESKNFSYRLRVSDSDRTDWYVTCFLMTWIPEPAKESSTDYTVEDEEGSP